MLLRSFGCALVLGAVAIGAMTVACGTDTPAQTSGTGDPWSIAASSATHSDLGVQTWGFRMIAPGTLSVRGYDDDNKRIVEVRQQIVQSDPYHWGLNLGVARSKGVSVLQLSLEARAAAGGTEVVGAASDQITDNASAIKILDHLRSDTAKRGSIGTSHSALTLQPATLTGDGDGQLTGNGDDQLTGDGSGLTSDGGSLTGDGGDDGQNGNSGSKGSKSDDQCQKSNDCGGNMMDSVAPLLGALSAAPQAISAFSAFYSCAQGDGGSAESVGLADLTKCAASSQGKGDAGTGTGSGSDPTALLSSVLSAFTSMQSTDQSCDCSKSKK